MRQHRLNLLIWLCLLFLAAAEFGMSFIRIPFGARPILELWAILMAGLVALGYMRLLRTPEIARGFAIAGIFWLTILLGLTMIDPLTRTIYPVVP